MRLRGVRTQSPGSPPSGDPAPARQAPRAGRLQPRRWMPALCALLALGLLVQLGLRMRYVPEADHHETKAPGGAERAAAPAASAPVASLPRMGSAPLVVPVAGVKPTQLTDTFTQARSDGERRHDAIDIMAARGTPVVAAMSGTVEKLFYSERGGNSVYVRTPNRRWILYYAHLDAYRAGLREGERVRPGTVIGTVGSTGNADPAGPHLHFAVARAAPNDRWYQGRPVNPYPLLRGR